MFSFVIIVNPLSCSYRMKNQWVLIWYMITDTYLERFYILTFASVLI